MEKRLFWREFWILWTAGVVTSAALAAQARLPITPVASLLLLEGHSSGALLFGTQAIEIPLELTIAVWCGLVAAHRVGLGAPLLERWLSADPTKIEVRRLLRSSIVVGTLVAITSIMANLPALHPNRQLAHREAEKIAASARSAEVGAKIAQFGKRVTFVSLTVSYVSDAVLRELIWRLFLLSSIVVLLGRIAGAKPGPTNTGTLISAVFLVAILGTATFLAWQTAATNMVYRSIRLTRTVYEPLWAAVAQALLRTVPGAIGFGFLYVRRGLESSMVSAVVAAFVAYILMLFVVVRFA